MVDPTLMGLDNDVDDEEEEEDEPLQQPPTPPLSEVIREREDYSGIPDFRPARLYQDT